MFIHNSHRKYSGGEFLRNDEYVLVDGSVISILYFLAVVIAAMCQTKGLAVRYVVFRRYNRI